MSIGLIFFVLSSAAAQEAGTRIVGAQGIEPYPFHTWCALREAIPRAGPSLPTQANVHHATGSHG